MEDVLDVYQRPYDSSYPVVCMDESPKQLIGEVREPLPAKPGSIEKVDDEYVRLGVAELFLAVEWIFLIISAGFSQISVSVL